MARTLKKTFVSSSLPGFTNLSLYVRSAPFQHKELSPLPLTADCAWTAPLSLQKIAAGKATMALNLMGLSGRRAAGKIVLASSFATRTACPLRRISARGFGSEPGSGAKGEPGFNPETPKQRMFWLSSVAGISAVTVYFLYRVYSDYFTDSGRHAAAERVMSTPLFEGNPVVFMDVAQDGKRLGRMVFQLRKDVGT
jgi:hypothetical protein